MSDVTLDCGRCEICPMRVVPETRFKRILFGIINGVKVPPPPTNDELGACTGSPDVKIGQVVETDAMSLSYVGQTVSGTCPAEGIHVRSNTLGSTAGLILTAITQENN